jgi:hypothetical protein
MHFSILDNIKITFNKSCFISSSLKTNYNYKEFVFYSFIFILLFSYSSEINANNFILHKSFIIMKEAIF